MPPMSSAARTATPPPATEERERVLRILRAHEAELRALGVAHLSLFGSLARGEAGPDSDADVLLDVPPGRKFSLFDLGEVRVALCELLGRDVDAVVRADLRPEFRRRIAQDVVLVF